MDPSPRQKRRRPRRYHAARCSRRCAGRLDDSPADGSTGGGDGEADDDVAAAGGAFVGYQWSNRWRIETDCAALLPAQSASSRGRPKRATEEQTSDALSWARYAGRPWERMRCAWLHSSLCSSAEFSGCSITDRHWSSQRIGLYLYERDPFRFQVEPAAAL